MAIPGPYRVKVISEPAWRPDHPGPVQRTPLPHWTTPVDPWVTRLTWMALGTLAGMGLMLAYLKWFPIPGDPICLR